MIVCMCVCMCAGADLALVHSAIECYHNLLGSMPEVSTYIQSLPSLVMQQTPTSLQRCVCGVCVCVWVWVCVHVYVHVCYMCMSCDLYSSTLVSAVMYFALHCHVMVEPSNLIKLYQPMLQDLHQLQVCVCVYVCACVCAWWRSVYMIRRGISCCYCCC